ncbi:MAG: S1 RNA-binding domain-containing protein [Eggerthella lenta]
MRDFDDLTVGMELVGTVRNVVDFGAFVGVGVKQDSLVRLQDGRPLRRHPSEVATVGDTVTVWVTGIDRTRQDLAVNGERQGVGARPHACR